MTDDLSVSLLLVSSYSKRLDLSEQLSDLLPSNGRVPQPTWSINWKYLIDLFTFSFHFRSIDSALFSCLFWIFSSSHYYEVKIVYGEKWRKIGLRGFKGKQETVDKTSNEYERNGSIGLTQTINLFVDPCCCCIDRMSESLWMQFELRIRAKGKWVRPLYIYQSWNLTRLADGNNKTKQNGRTTVTKRIDSILYKGKMHKFNSHLVYTHALLRYFMHDTMKTIDQTKILSCIK